MSEILVGAAEGTGKALGMSQVFIGIVFLAIVGGAAESSSAIAMALRNKMDITIGIALGSCIQIALFVSTRTGARELHHRAAAARALLQPARDRLTFHGGSDRRPVVAGDGRSNWSQGVQLVTVYLIIALMFYFIPVAA